MYTIKSTAPGGVVLGYYGSFDTLATAQKIAGNVTRLARHDYNHYTAVPTPEGVTPTPLHPRYLG